MGSRRMNETSVRDGKAVECVCEYALQFAADEKNHDFFSYALRISRARLVVLQTCLTGLLRI